LFWVSLTLAGAAVVLALDSRTSSRATDPNATTGFWRRTLLPPWRWPAVKWIDFASLNVAIAAGAAVGYFVG
jgi:hypothetical protein